jgi:hypothetical protein
VGRYRSCRRPSAQGIEPGRGGVFEWELSRAAEPDWAVEFANEIIHGVPVKLDGASIWFDSEQGESTSQAERVRTLVRATNARYRETVASKEPDA